MAVADDEGMEKHEKLDDDDDDDEGFDKQGFLLWVSRNQALDSALAAAAVDDKALGGGVGFDEDDDVWEIDYDFADDEKSEKCCGHYN